MDPLTITLIVIGIIIVLLLPFIFGGARIHKIMFDRRFVLDENIKKRSYNAKEFGLYYEKVSFKCGKKNINGYLYYYDDYNDKKLVVFCHGYDSCKESYIQDIEYLCKKGYQVLGFDYLGTNESDGKLTGFGSSVKCANLALKYVKANYPTKDIYVVGHSWGGFATSNVVKYHKDIKGIVVMSGFTKASRVYKVFLNKYIFMLPFIMISEFFKTGKYAFANSLKSLKKYNGQALFIASNDDPLVNTETNIKLIEKKYPNFEYLYVDNKGHNPEYTEEAVKNLNKFLTDFRNTNQEGKQKLLKTADFKSMGALDTNVMDKIVEFISK